MADKPKNIATSVRQQLLNLARTEGQAFDVVLVAFGLERFIYRLSVSAHRDRFVLKGGMLVTLWTKDKGRFTRDIDFLSFGAEDEATLKKTIAEILAIDAGDGLVFDDASLTVAPIREDQVYGGMRLKTTAYLEKTRIPITIDVGFGDALGNPDYTLDYGSLLDFPSASVRAYSPETVIAEKFQAIVALGIVNGRMKDYYDLWALPKAVELTLDDLRTSIEMTFERRQTGVPKERPPGLSQEFATDATKSAQWLAYSEATEIEGLSLGQVVDDIWTTLEPICAHTGTAK
ncbi:nucleotidyl transferase AbiEii/AbiGii toxin family protein [uncultured Boseongicola sp.]|jgi:predicted nucleotidyltransferase component of viral defense system|uniref:nucleotidyl transferase AbiEii/AbiGii toxin family protein n=1 Tax=uncultured Boseongicola sp. TaxID=1648499 RepID=UPI00260B60A9|nr:nucleotidyl transferase AbiEii/AbiGii toxin family protein [uncultured Boseongicola sp.]